MSEAIKKQTVDLMEQPQTYVDQLAKHVGEEVTLNRQQAKENIGSKVEAITFTAPIKEKLAFGLRADFEDRKLRISRDEKLRTDLRGLRKEVSLSGNIRFIGETEDSHCDRTWAKALRQHAARHRFSAGGMVV